MRSRQLAVLFGGLAVIGLTVGAVASYQQNQRLGKPGVRYQEIAGSVAVEVLLPQDLPGYRSESLPVTQEELDMLPKDTSFGRRRFVAPDGLAFDLSVVVMGGDQSSIHRPQSCIPAQGWTITRQDTDTIRIQGTDTYDLNYNRLLNSKTVPVEGNPVPVESFYVYWFAADGKVTASRERRIVSTAWHMLTAGEVERWAYVSVHSAFRAGASEAVYPRIRAFLETAVPELQLPPDDAAAERQKR